MINFNYNTDKYRHIEINKILKDDTEDNENELDKAIKELLKKEFHNEKMRILHNYFDKLQSVEHLQEKMNDTEEQEQEIEEQEEGINC